MAEDPDKKAARWRRWYEKNKKKYNAERRKRYATDPKYRKRCMMQSEMTRVMTKIDREKERGR